MQDRKMTGRLGPRLLGAVVVLVYAFTLFPLGFVVWMSFFADPIPAFPPEGYSLRWYVSAWQNPSFAGGFLLSLKIALCASLIGVAFGVAAAIGLKRFAIPGSGWISTMLMSPLVVPGIVAGIAVYLFMLRVENAWDADIVGTLPALVAAHVCLTIPWTLRLVYASLAGLDEMVEEAAQNLGAPSHVVFWRITLPMLRPALVASMLFSFIISFENLEATLLLVGAGSTTLPIAILQYLEFNLDPTIAAVSTVQIALLGVLMLVADRFVSLSKVV